MTNKTKYSFAIGLKKTLKNATVTMIIPALVYLSNSYTEWLPKQYWPFAIAAGSLIGYFTKNYIENK